MTNQRVLEETHGEIVAMRQDATPISVPRGKLEIVLATATSAMMRVVENTAFDGQATHRVNALIIDALMELQSQVHQSRVADGTAEPQEAS